MVKEIFARIIESIEDNVLEKEINLDKNAFVEIKKSIVSRKIAFIDGGQAELLKAVNFSLQLIRVGAIIYKNSKKVDSLLNEFFVLIHAKDDEEYQTEVFPLKGDGIDNLSINSFDSSIREGNERASVSKIGNIVRRFAELDLAKRVVEKLEREDVIILDGSLKCMVKGESKYIGELYGKAEENGVVVAGLAKTNKILTKNGSCVGSQLDKLSGAKAEWYYGLEDETDYAVGIAKLNKSSEHVFEFNIAGSHKNFKGDVLSLLSANSKDVVFPGYPYGLIQVDRFARVSNGERDYWLTIFKANAGSKWNRLKADLNILNAHEILDNI